MMESSFAEIEPAGTGTTWDDFAWAISYTPEPTGTIGSESDEQVDRLRAAQVRTMDLDAAFFEDYGGELQESSRAAFECFMQYNQVSQPLLGAEPTGILEATWARGNECLSIRFNDRYRLAYAISYVTDDGVHRRTWGESSLSTFFSDCPEGKRLASN
jgi:hypothetical protein